MSNEIRAPNSLVSSGTSVFLAGSIEMGKASDWQKYVVQHIDKRITIFNPRRDNWDSSWVQDIKNEKFNEQVTWELMGMEQADIIAMYFDPGTNSPITLLEMGLWCKSRKLIVCCPTGFSRKGNVDVTCQRYNVEQVDSLDELITAVNVRYEMMIERSLDV
jgi:hypothetical protein